MAYAGKTPTSRFIGVFWDESSADWSVDVRVGGRWLHIANFKDEIRAAEEYDKFAKKLVPNPKLNFPTEARESPLRLSPRFQPSGRLRSSRAAPAKPVTAAASAKKSATAAASAKKKNATVASRGSASSATTAFGVKYKGVFFNRRRGNRPWEGQIWIPPSISLRRQFYVGSFATPEEAARAVDSALRQFFVDPVCNFREDGTLNPDRLHRSPRRHLRPNARKKIEAIWRQRQATKEGAGRTADQARAVAVRQPQKKASGWWDDDDSDRPDSDWAGESEEEGEGNDAWDGGDGGDEEGGGWEGDEGGDDEGQQEVLVKEEREDEDNEEAEDEEDEEDDEEKEAEGRLQCHRPFADASTGSAGTAPTSATSDAVKNGRSVSHGAAVDVWVELKTAVFRKLMSVDGPALSEDEACKYRALLQLLNKPTASLRGFVEDVVLRSGFSAEVADRAAGLLADMAECGGFDE